MTETQGKSTNEEINEMILLRKLYQSRQLITEKNKLTNVTSVNSQRNDKNKIRLVIEPNE